MLSNLFIFISCLFVNRPVVKRLDCLQDAFNLDLSLEELKLCFKYYKEGNWYYFSDQYRYRLTKLNTSK